MPFIPEIELKSIEEQSAFQFDRLKVALHYLNKQSPYYQKVFREHAIDISAITSWQDFHQLPTTSKQDLQHHNWDFLCVPRKDISEYTATSGTMGRPVTIALTANDLQRLAYNEYLSFHTINAGEGDIFQLMLTLDRQFMAGIAYYNGLAKSGVSAVRTGPGLPAMQWETIQQLGITGLVAVPSFLLKMIEYARTNHISLNHSTVKKVLAIGESLRDEHLQWNALAQKIKTDWNIELYSTYASTEMQTAFTECPAGQGGHHHPELIIAEILDDEGKPVQEGMMGEVTITTLGVEGMPLLRYRTGDICRAYYEPCSCGRHTMRLGPVLGRKQQMIKFKGTTLYPPVIFEVLNSISAVKEYVVTVATGNDHQDSLLIHLHADLEQEACNALLKPVFQHKWRVTPELIYCTADEIRIMQFPNNSRKPIKFIDLRNHP